ncbi:hypothetical protein L195_g014940 [Trifolium pratense]|uniref:Uncharacterized protein n=1 Tax=Trifolium pratense TaxID=57577 RepID=A0A2K3MM27_TRIPR|nr:hypothetical protein L195_g014940 [Trifolium pratense]
MSMTNESSWVGRKAVKRIGGMSDALSIAADLGFTVSSTPSSTSSHEPPQISSPTNGEKGEDLIRVLRELTSVQRKIADLQVELQGRKDDKNVAHLTHVSEMEKKIETLAKITTILKDVIHNKIGVMGSRVLMELSASGAFRFWEALCIILPPRLSLVLKMEDRIIARLQQPYSLDCIPVEAEYQIKLDRMTSIETVRLGSKKIKDSLVCIKKLYIDGLDLYASPFY